MLLMVRAALRLLVKVRFLATLVAATATLPKTRLAGAKVAPGAEVPYTGNSCGAFLPLS